MSIALNLIGKTHDRHLVTIYDHFERKCSENESGGPQDFQSTVSAAEPSTMATVKWDKSKIRENYSEIFF
jgi:hypothetical protein